MHGEAYRGALLPIRAEARCEPGVMRLRPAPAARRSFARLAALPLVVLLVAGCSSSADPAPPPPSPVTGAAASTSPVAELQAGLTTLLVERVHVVAAMTTGVARGDATNEILALDAVSVALADVLGATYSAAREPLLQALREHDRLLVQHAAAVTGSGPDDVRDELLESQLAVARVVRQVVPTLDVNEVALGLGAEVTAQRNPPSYEQLREAAAEAQRTARLLTAAVSDDRGLGSASAGAARWRSDVTALLTEHVLLTGALARELRTPGSGSMSARRALDANAVALADLLGDPYAALRGAFLRSWSAHLDRLERYAAGRAADADAVAEPGLVSGYPDELARLVAEHVRGLPAQSVRTELDRALDAQLDAVDAAARNEPRAPQLLREATAAVLPAAALLSAAVAEDLRLS